MHSLQPRQLGKDRLLKHGSYSPSGQCMHTTASCFSVQGDPSAAALGEEELGALAAQPAPGGAGAQPGGCAGSAPGARAAAGRLRARLAHPQPRQLLLRARQPQQRRRQPEGTKSQASCQCLSCTDHGHLPEHPHDILNVVFRLRRCSPHAGHCAHTASELQGEGGRCDPRPMQIATTVNDYDAQCLQRGLSVQSQC